MGVFRLCIGQSPAELSTTAARLEWLRNILPEAASKQTDLLLLPELFATGYYIGDQIAARAEPIDGPTAQTIAALAQAHNIAIHYGFAETDGQNTFNAAQCFGPNGMRLGGHRKLAIPPGFESDQFKRGEGCSLFIYRGLRIATLICYDAEFPETARHVSEMGAELILVPTALGVQWDWVSKTMIPTRAYENGVFLAYANSAGTENGIAFLGQSFIAAPNGKELARAEASPQLIYAELKRDEVTKAQNRLPYLNDLKMLKRR